MADRLDEETRYRSMGDSTHEETGIIELGERKSSIPDWMDARHMFVVGVLDRYAVANKPVFEEMLESEKAYGYLELNAVSISDIEDGMTDLQQEGIILKKHGSYSLTDLGESYVQEFDDPPTASGFLEKHTTGAVIVLLMLGFGWVALLPQIATTCRPLFPDVFTCGLPLVVMPLLGLFLMIQAGHGIRASQEIAGLFDLSIRHGDRSYLSEETYMNAIYARLAHTLPATTVISACVLATIILILDVLLLRGIVNNQAYGLTFDAFAGYLLAKNEFRQGERLPLSKGSGLETGSNSGQAHDFLDGTVGMFLLVIGFLLQLAAIFPTWELRQEIINLAISIL